MPKPTTQCSNCGRDAPIVRGEYEFKESGLPVLLKGIDIIRCRECGNEDPIIPKVNQLMRVIALAVIAQPYRLCGADVRFLRKYLRLTGEEFSKLLSVDKTTLSKWENDADPIGEPSDRLIRVIALALGAGMKSELARIIRGFPRKSAESAKKKIEVKEDLTYEYV